MKRNCCKCGRLVDTENEEFLNTIEGILCIECANGYEDQSVESDSSDLDQNYM